MTTAFVNLTNFRENYDKVAEEREFKLKNYLRVYLFSVAVFSEDGL
jgi:hypothetical protein